MNKTEAFIDLIKSNFGPDEPMLTQLKAIKHLQDNRHTIIAKYNQQKTSKGINFANNWIKNYTLATGEIKMACHPEKWANQPDTHSNYAMSIVNTCQSNLDQVYDAVMELPGDKRNQFLTAFLVNWKSVLVGSCLDNLCEGLATALETLNPQVAYHQPYFDPKKTIIQNLSEYAVKFRDNTCIDCLITQGTYNQTKMDKCVKNQIWTPQPVVPLMTKHLKYLIGKQCKDGVINQGHIDQYIKDYQDYLMNCDSVKDMILPDNLKPKPITKPKPKHKLQPQFQMPAAGTTLSSQYLVGLNTKVVAELNKLAQGCPQDKIKNPKTGICVKIDGAVGKGVIQDLKQKHPTAQVPAVLAPIPAVPAKIPLKYKQTQVPAPAPAKLPLKKKTELTEADFTFALENLDFDTVLKEIKYFKTDQPYPFTSGSAKPIFYLISRLPESKELLTALIGLDMIDINATDNQNESVLNRLISTFDNIDLIKLVLMNPKLLPNSANGKQLTPLNYALKNSNFEASKALLKSPKININQPSPSGVLPFVRVVDLYKKYKYPILFDTLTQFLSREDFVISPVISNKIATIPQLKKYLEFYHYKKKLMAKKKTAPKLPKPVQWTQWQKLCHKLASSELSQKEVAQLRQWGNKAQISNSATLKPMALCVELAKSLSEYEQTQTIAMKTTCKNDANLLGDEFTTIPEVDIIQDDDGYCFSSNELDQITALKTHPFTNLPWDQVTVKGQPFLTHVKNLPKNLLYEVHQLHPSNLQEMSEDSILTLELVDLVNEPQMKYLTPHTVEYFRAKPKGRSHVLYALTKQDISTKNKSLLNLMKSPLITTKFAHVNYLDFVQMLMTYIKQIPSAYQETAKYLVIEILNQTIQQGH